MNLIELIKKEIIPKKIPKTEKLIQIKYIVNNMGITCSIEDAKYYYKKAMNEGE